MKKYILLAVFAAFAALLHAQTAEDTITENGSLTSLEKMKIEMLEEGLTSANAQIIEINDALRSHVTIQAIGIGSSAVGAAFLYSASRQEIVNHASEAMARQKRTAGYLFVSLGAAGFLASYLPLILPNVHLEGNGLVIKFGKP